MHFSKMKHQFFFVLKLAQKVSDKTDNPLLNYSNLYWGAISWT